MTTRNTWKETRDQTVETEEDDTLAVVHVDWAEQHQLSEVKEVPSACWLLSL